jgi:transcriptional regulator with XRE-family HTH domain
MAQVIETVAAKVKVLRKSSGLSAQALAERMSDLGVPWKREVVANLENGRRASVGVDELLALALVFGVPPVLLMVDETAGTAEVAPGTLTTPAQALLWLIGEVPWAAGPSWQARWSESSVPIRLVRRFHDFAEMVANEIRMVEQIDMAGLEARPGVDHKRRLTGFLDQLQRVVQEMRACGMRVPHLPDAVLAEAAAHGLKDLAEAQGSVSDDQ